MDFKHTSIKQSALGWVKKSIDDNLATVRSDLNIYVEDMDVSMLTSVESKLGDVQGVLTMIEQYGAAMLTEEMRSLCQFIASREKQDDQALEVLLRAVLQLPDYLENIQAGQKDIPIAILPLLNDIRAAKNEDLFSEKLLFLPDLSMHMDDSEYDAIDEHKNQASRLLAKKVRPPYQYSLLGVITDRDVHNNLARLQKITEIMEERSGSEQVARFWWIVSALIESISRDDLPLGVSVKMLMGKIDQIFRSMIVKGEKELVLHQPIDLIKNLLYYIAQPECDGPKSQAIKTAYRLEQFLPVDDNKDQASIAGPNQELLKTVSDAVKADLEEVKSSLEVYVTGDMGKTDQLSGIPRDLHIISDTLAMIGLGPQRQVIESQIKVINDIVEGHSPPDQEKLLSMAAELIQVDHALELLHKGQYLQADGDQTSGSASRNFEMNNMLSAVVSAALDDIQKIKDAILDFIKDSTKAENIEFCKTLLNETRGALDLLNQDRAVEVVDGFMQYLQEHDIVDFMDTNRLDQLSQVVVGIEYFLEALGEQRDDVDSILDFADNQLQLLLQGSSVSAKTETSEFDDENLLIDDDFEEIDEAALADVNLDNMETELADDLGDEDDLNDNMEPPADAPIELQRSEMNGFVLDLNTDLEAIQDVLEPATKDQQDEPESEDAEDKETDQQTEFIQIPEFEDPDQEQMVDVEEEDNFDLQLEELPEQPEHVDVERPESKQDLSEDEASHALTDDERGDWPELEQTEDELPAPEVDTQEPAVEEESQSPQVEQDDEDQQPGTLNVVPVNEDLIILKPDSDEEILEIYLEEAEEESENIRQQQQDWKLHPEDENALKNIRRAFHTIKGSGRLVGAMKIGEFAWDYESLLNRVIDKSVLPGEPVIDAIGQAAEALPQLVEELKSGKAPTADIPYLRGLARALAEFKADKVLEIRQAKHETVDQPSSQVDTDQDNEDIAEEPEPAIEEQGAADSSTGIDQASPEIDGSGESSEKAPSAEPDREGPPDPFVSGETDSMPGKEAETGLSLDQMEDEINDLQLDPELLIIYQQEVESHLNTVNSVLDKSQEGGELIPSEELYRAIHTINGASRTADITTIGVLATLLEKPLKKILEDGTGLDEEVLQLYRQGHDAIYQMTQDLVKNRQMPVMPETLQTDLESLYEQMDNHTVELPEQNNQPSNQFIDTLTMMNESADSEQDDELVDIFIEEATDLLEMSDHTLQSWQEQDENNEKNIDFGLVMELQRYLHTLKGGAKMADFHEISDLSHELESAFIAVIDNRIEKTQDLIDVLHESFDLLQKQVEQARNHEPMESSQEQINQLIQLRRGKTEEKKSAQPTFREEPKGQDNTRAEVEERDKEELSRRDSDKSGDRRGIEQDVVKVRADLLDNLVNSAGEVSIYRARMEQQVSSFGSNLGELGQTILRLKNQLRSLEAETDAQIHFSHRQDAETSKSFDPLEMDRYTQIQELSKSLSESVDDLSSLQSILGEQVKDSETLLLQQSRINTDLQDGLIRSRMVRFSGLTSRLRRLVRQTSSELARKTDLEIHGEHNEVDIKVLDRMVAPLEHIIRNAISHGIESPVERVNKGKSETGTILIEVSRDGSDVIVKISDDGAGVNVEKVRSRALQLGLLGEHEELAESDIIQFILEPGFSTADHVSQVAGRGVGMDVVDSNIKQLGGTLQISTSPQGSVFTARLPFTLSINQAILVRAGEESYALPLINIEGITRIESDQMMEFYQQEKPTLDYAGQQYGLFYLSTMLEITNDFHVTDPMLKVPIILLRSGDLRIALHIDEIIGNREIVVKPLGRQLSQVKGLSGATILADGLVVLILDINGLIRHGVSTQVVADQRVEIVPREESKTKKVVMVVDDSITMRRVATRLLTRNNYEVVTAKDGVDALAQLDETDPDVMLLDIEMPRMDGFELALHMQNDQNLRDIPIIMITSRTGSKHRDHAMQLGVSKYMGKPYQESELIENIAELVG
jgi:chemosensory pili system protein ChpA (sensor histidine kinase/response regulator)